MDFFVVVHCCCSVCTRALVLLDGYVVFCRSFPALRGTQFEMMRLMCFVRARLVRGGKTREGREATRSLMTTRQSFGV